MQRTYAEVNTQTYTPNTAIPRKTTLSEFNSGLRHAVRQLFFRKKGLKSAGPNLEGIPSVDRRFINVRSSTEK